MGQITRALSQTCALAITFTLLRGVLSSHLHAADLGDAPRWAEMRTQIEQYRRGARSDEDAYVLLRRMLRHCGATKRMGSVECKALESDWRGLRERRPDLVAKPPQLTSEQEKAKKAGEERAKSEEKRAEALAKNFVPKDDRGSIFWSGSKIAVFFQYRAEFYSLSKGVSCEVQFGGKSVPVQDSKFQGITSWLRFSKNGSGIRIRPEKTIYFSDKVSTARRVDRKAQKYEAVAVHTVLLNPGYAPGDENEYLTVGFLARQGKKPKPPIRQGALKNFYGIISIDGRILKTVSFTGRSPDRLLVGLKSLPDGTSFFGEGGSIRSNDGEYLTFGNVSQIIHWSPNADIEKTSVEEAINKYSELREFPWLGN